MFEEDIEKLQLEKAGLIHQRDNKEDEQLSIPTLVEYAQYFMEHIDELLLDGPNPLQNAAMFGLLFRDTPNTAIQPALSRKANTTMKTIINFCCGWESQLFLNFYKPSMQ